MRGPREGLLRLAEQAALSVNRYAMYCGSLLCGLNAQTAYVAGVAT